MDFGTRFLILSINGENFAFPIVRLREITVPRNLVKDPKQADIFEGKMDYRGAMIPVLNVKKALKLVGAPGGNLLVVYSGSGLLGLLVDEVKEIMDADQKPAPVPKGVLNPSVRCYSGILRYRDDLVPLLDEDGMLS
jgi:chemotaxis signal transduction protein